MGKTSERHSAFLTGIKIERKQIQTAKNGSNAFIEYQLW